LVTTSGILQSLVACLQDERAKDIAGKTLSIIAMDEEAKRRIIDIVVCDVRTRKITTFF
jgi:ribulose bisphosphate carboxylase small subunit